MAIISYRRQRFPPAVIQHAVWLYLRFTLSYRHVEELLAERGLDISYEDCGRDAHCWAPPAQNRTCGIPASGSHLGCLTAKCPYTVQSRGHACPARSPARAGLSRVLPGPLPSLHQLRLRSHDAVRRLRSYYGEG